MRTEIKDKILAEERRVLMESPYDEVHGIKHHEDVWKVCLWVVSQEELESQVDLDTLEVAAFGHDIDRGSEEPEILRGILEKSGAEGEFTKKVLTVVKEHPVGSKQSSLEAKVLYDADKLEYVGLKRSKDARDAARKGLVKESVLLKWVDDWHSRLPQVIKSLNFSCTRKRFKEDLKRLVDQVRSDPDYSNLLDESKIKSYFSMLE